MHRPSSYRRAFGLASLASMFAGLAGSIPMVQDAATKAGDAMLDMVAALKPSRTRSRGAGRKNYNKPDQTTPHYRARQMLAARWRAGEKVPRDVVEAMEAHALRRAPINERRAYAARRAAEGVVRARQSYCDRVIEVPARYRGNAHAYVQHMWENRIPFPADIMGVV